MAGKPRFRVPTLEQMEAADQEETMASGISLFKQKTASNSESASAASDSKISAQTLNKSSPPKRMISQKALLSRQPLSKQLNNAKSKTSPTKSAQKSSGNAEPKGGGSSTDILSHQRISRVTSENISRTNVKATSVMLTDETRRQTGSASGYTSHSAESRESHQGSTSAESATKDHMVHNQHQELPATSSNLEQAPADKDAVRADVLPTLAKLGKTNSLVVNPRQRGNPILKFVRNVPWEFGNIVPDYVMGQCNCALYLSLRYHQLHPEYIHTRLQQLGRSFDLRVLLVQVDIKDPHHLLKDLAKICILADCTLMLAFSPEEAGRYLETYKVYENKAAEAIMERTDSNFSVQLSDCLTRVKSVNKTDCSTLLATFGSLQGIMEASIEDLSLCPGFGPQKAKRLHDVFREPFLVSKKQRTDIGK